MYYVLKPYYSARDQIMTLKDKYDAYKWLSENNTVSRKKRINKFTWDELYSTGEEEGKEACTNNKLYVYDDYYSS